MSTVRRRGLKFELRVKNSLLPNGIFTATFEDEVAARNYGKQLDALLAQGVVPAELAAKRGRGVTPTLSRVISDYRGEAPISALDDSILDLLRAQVGGERIETVIQYVWAESWVKSMKLQNNLAPGTIRKRVGTLARMLDWYLRHDAEAGRQPLANPLRLLPKNYSAYSKSDQHLIKALPGKRVKVDVERIRRLEDGEDAAIVAALSGMKRPDRERSLELPDGSAMLDLYHLIANTGLRLREAYSLRPEHVKLKLRTIHIADSKTDEARDVPMLPVIYAMLEQRVREAKRAQSNLIFPFWDGDDSELTLKRATARLSRSFARAFEYAGCIGLKEHDLRHEATCRWMLMRDNRGGWMFRSEEVMKITGHKTLKTFMRYLSLRGSDLAQRLWD